MGLRMAHGQVSYRNFDAVVLAFEANKILQGGAEMEGFHGSTPPICCIYRWVFHYKPPINGGTPRAPISLAVQALTFKLFFLMSPAFWS
jgi:hypothetical protein